MSTGIQISPQGLGMVASGKRNIRSGSEYNKYFDLSGLQSTDPIIVKDGSNYDTLREMEKIAKKYSSQVRSIAQKLKGSSLSATLRNTFEFLYNHVQYKPDNSEREQLRTPLRTWKDRASGADCDCFAIFISAVLHELKINHAFRMAAYNGDFQHVYVVVPHDGKSTSLSVRTKYSVVDPVVDKFNYEVSFTKKYDRFMSAGLNGLGMVLSAASNPGTCGTGRRNIGDDLMRVEYLKEIGYTITEEFLSQNAIPFGTVRTVDGAIRFNVTAPNGEIITLGPVIGATALAEFKSKMKETPTLPGGPNDKPCGCKKSNWFWWALGSATAAMVVFGGNGKEKKSSGLSGVPTKRTPKVVRID